MYELMKPERSVYHRLEAGERELARLNTNDRLLDVALHGVDSVREARNCPHRHQQPTVNNSQPAEAEPLEPLRMNSKSIFSMAPCCTSRTLILTSASLGEEPAAASTGWPPDLEISYADRLDNVSVKVNRIFGDIINDLFNDDELLPRLRRLFWLEATKAERDLQQPIW